MGLWSKMFGKPPKPPSPVPRFPFPSSPFQDRPPIRRMLYYFQHAALRDSALMWHDCMAEVIAAGRIGEENARYFWAKATNLALLAGAIPGSLLPSLEPTSPDDPAHIMLEEGVRILTSVPIHTRRRDEFTAHVFVMPPPEHSVEAHFIGVVHRGDEPARTVRYFTLERVGDGSRPPCVCEWVSSGGHVNHGDRLEPDLDAFSEDILSRAQPS